MTKPTRPPDYEAFDDQWVIPRHFKFWWDEQIVSWDTDWSGAIWTFFHIDPINGMYYMMPKHGSKKSQRNYFKEHCQTDKVDREYNSHIVNKVILG